MRSGRNSERLFWGLCLMGLGVLMLLQRMGLIEHHLWSRFWPLIIVAVGVANVVSSRAFWRGAWIIAAGLWLQAITLGLFGLTFGNSWPLLLIASGASMVLRTFLDVRRRQQRESDFARDMENHHEQ